MVTKTRKRKKKKLSFNQEEYKELRAEMMQRFEYTRTLLLFLITSTIALYSFMAYSQAVLSLIPLSGFWFVIAGLFLTGFFAYAYRTTHFFIYRAGSYLAVFHERASREDGTLLWHWLSRFGYSDWVPKKKKKWVGTLEVSMWPIFIIMVALDLGVPLLLLMNTFTLPALPDPNFAVWIVMACIVVGIFCFIVRVSWSLGKITDVMEQTMFRWLYIRDKMEEDPSWFDTQVEEKIDAIFKKFS